MENSVLNKLVKALEKADNGSLLVNDSILELYKKNMKKKDPSFKLDNTQFCSDKFKRDFCKFMLQVYIKAYENFFNGFKCSEEILARFWAGGLYGFQTQETSYYWEEVKKNL